MTILLSLHLNLIDSIELFVLIPMFLRFVFFLQPTDLIGWMELNLMLGVSYTIVYFIEASIQVKNTILVTVEQIKRN